MAIVITVDREELKDAILNVIEFIENDNCQHVEKHIEKKRVACWC